MIEYGELEIKRKIIENIIMFPYNLPRMQLKHIQIVCADFCR